MSGEENKLNEGVKEGKQRSLIEPGEKREKPIEEVTPGEQTPKEQEPKDWEKEYQTLQSQKDKEVTEAKAETGRLQVLVAPYAKHIKKTETGGYAFDFAELEKPKERVSEPNKDLWLTDIEAATKQQNAFDNQAREDKAKVEREEQIVIAEDKAFDKEWAESWAKTIKLYPDMAVEDSDFRKEADTVLKANPNLAEVARCNEIVAEVVARKRGVAPVEKGEETPAPEKKEEKDTSYIVSGGPSSKAKGEQKKESETESPEEYVANRKKLLASKSLGVHT